MHLITGSSDCTCTIDHGSVSINGFIEDCWHAKYGVPQDSVLEPFLFAIYINDLNPDIRKVSTFHFADDTCLHKRFN